MPINTFSADVLSAGSAAVAASIKARTILCTWEHVVGAFRVDHDVMVDVLKDLGVAMSNVQAIGTLNKSYQWHVTLRQLGTQYDRVILEGGISYTVTDSQNVTSTRRVTFVPLQPRAVAVSILWVPVHVSDMVVRDLMKTIAGSDGQVDQCQRETRIVGGYNEVCSTTRFNCRLLGVWPETIPERVTLFVHGERVPVLLLVAGRPRTCFLCGGHGHTQKRCEHPVCRYCHVEGHFVSSCPKKNGGEGPWGTAPSTAASVPSTQTTNSVNVSAASSSPSGASTSVTTSTMVTASASAPLVAPTVAPPVTPPGDNVQAGGNSPPPGPGGVELPLTVTGSLQSAQVKRPSTEESDAPVSKKQSLPDSKEQSLPDPESDMDDLADTSQDRLVIDDDTA